ncbi:MFS transporter [Arthrobacter sp. AZCC_0090]|uniref:MFS transporter n=1 Tax=Arthrobacter sp. AZCC_0090 TaxID=2735881 RepID=UPI0016082701|nr:MFS transporter [Arthrobacter sp. AZCC_0090]MBB6404050.1 MFS family permease [Arthrobacter sp. AZCC_0090]
MLRLLSHPKYRPFFFSFTAGNFAEGLVAVTVPFVLLQRTGDPAAVGFCLALQTAGVLVMAFPGASIADRFPRQKVVSWSYWAAGLALVGICIALGTDLGTWAVGAGLFLFGASTAVYGPASDAMTPRLVSEEYLHKANSMDSLSQRIGQGILGPLLGGAMVAMGMGIGAFALSALLCVFGAIIARRIQLLPPATDNCQQEEASENSNWASVLRYLKKTPLLVALLAWVSIFIMLQVGAKPVAATIWITDIQDGGAALYGIALSIGAVISAVVVLIIGASPLPSKYLAWMITAWSLGSGMLMLAVLLPSAWSFIISYALAAGLMAIGNIYWSTYIQSTVPDRLLARVISIDWVASLALTPLGAAVAGTVVSQWGAGPTFSTAALVPLFSGLGMLTLILRAKSQGAETRRNSRQELAPDVMD